MTDDQIREWIAEYVMGWQIVRPDSRRDESQRTYYAADGMTSVWADKWNPLASPADALNALGKWWKSGTSRTFEIYGRKDSVTCEATLFGDDGSGLWYDTDADLPRAICLALVEATGGKP